MSIKSEPDQYRRTVVALGIALTVVGFGVIGWALWTGVATNDVGEHGILTGIVTFDDLVATIGEHDVRRSLEKSLLPLGPPESSPDRQS